jgi:hypothetical protein
MSSLTADTITLCANCGKGEESAGDLKSCTACKMVKYCNRDCQIAHRPQHKKECKKRAAELHDEALFKDPPSREDCPICFLPLPVDAAETLFKVCCGKTICIGCIHVMTVEDIKKGKKKEEIDICAFCRTLRPSSDEEYIERLAKLMDNGNAGAFYQLAGHYASGSSGMPQNRAKANELWLKAGELGCAEAYSRLGYSYVNGMGVEADKKKAKHYWEFAAMKGDAQARHNLGVMEGKAGNLHRACKHMIIAAKAGNPPSLDNVKIRFRNEHVTKDEYESTLRAYHERQTEMKSEARDAAFTFKTRLAAEPS